MKQFSDFITEMYEQINDEILIKQWQNDSQNKSFEQYKKDAYEKARVSNMSAKQLEQEAKSVEMDILTAFGIKEREEENDGNI